MSQDVLWANVYGQLETTDLTENIPDLEILAGEFHTAKWEYIKGIERGLLLLR